MSRISTMSNALAGFNSMSTDRFEGAKALISKFADLSVTPAMPTDSNTSEVKYRPAGQQWPVCTP